MARLEIVVEEVDISAEEAGERPRESGLLLADILKRTSGLYSWDWPVDRRIATGWREIGELLGDEKLREAAARETIPISFEHLRDRVPTETRVMIRFEVSYTPEEGQVIARAEAAGLI